MPAPRSSFARLRFASAGAAPFTTGIPPASAPTDGGGVEMLLMDVPREEGLALLDWLGLGRPDFGAIAARELAPRCRRRLWVVARNADASLRGRTTELLALAEAAGEGMVLFG